MAKTINDPNFLYLASTLLVLVIIQCHIIVVTAKPGGLTIELIHRNSPESPFYQPNLTHQQRIQALAHQSIARSQYLKNVTAYLAATKNRTLSYSPETARMIMNPFQDFALYNAKIGVGTVPTSYPQYKTYNLLVDTGSDITWLQCEECSTRQCFISADEPFPSSHSTSYKRLPCKRHPLCEDDCIGDFCAFNIVYADTSAVAGYIASETFIFASSTGGPAGMEFVNDLAFGCAIDNKGVSFATEGNQISGVLGLGFGPRSFASQLRFAGQSDGRFSYCLRRERLIGPINSFIKFGADIEQRPDLSVTALRRYNNLVTYYVNLLGISINGRRLNIPEAQFAVQRDGSGGTIIDSGTSFTSIIRPAYDVLVRGLEDVFSALGDTVQRLPRGNIPFELCYRVMKPQAFPGYPVITFIFQNNANMNLDPEAAFLIGNDMPGNTDFCMAMVPENDPHGTTSIGAFQQTNYRFIYDPITFKLFFGPENCFHSS